MLYRAWAGNLESVRVHLSSIKLDHYLSLSFETSKENHKFSSQTRRKSPRTMCLWVMCRQPTYWHTHTLQHKPFAGKKHIKWGWRFQKAITMWNQEKELLDERKEQMWRRKTRWEKESRWWWRFGSVQWKQKTAKRFLTFFNVTHTATGRGQWRRILTHLCFFWISYIVKQHWRAYILIYSMEWWTGSPYHYENERENPHLENLLTLTSF